MRRKLPCILSCICPWSYAAPPLEATLAPRTRATMARVPSDGSQTLHLFPPSLFTPAPFSPRTLLPSRPPPLAPFSPHALLASRPSSARALLPSRLLPSRRATCSPHVIFPLSLTRRPSPVPEPAPLPFSQTSSFVSIATN